MKATGRPFVRASILSTSQEVKLIFLENKNQVQERILKDEILTFDWQEEIIDMKAKPTCSSIKPNLSEEEKENHHSEINLSGDQSQSDEPHLFKPHMATKRVRKTVKKSQSKSLKAEKQNSKIQLIYTESEEESEFEIQESRKKKKSINLKREFTKLNEEFTKIKQSIGRIQKALGDISRKLSK